MNTVMTDDTKITEILNNYFINIAIKLDEQLPVNNIDPLSYVLQNNVSKRIGLKILSDDRVSIIFYRIT